MEYVKKDSVNSKGLNIYGLKWICISKYYYNKNMDLIKPSDLIQAVH